MYIEFRMFRFLFRNHSDQSLHVCLSCPFLLILFPFRFLSSYQGFVPDGFIIKEVSENIHEFSVSGSFSGVSGSLGQRLNICSRFEKVTLFHKKVFLSGKIWYDKNQGIKLLRMNSDFEILY